MEGIIVEELVKECIGEHGHGIFIEEEEDEVEEESGTESGAMNEDPPSSNGEYSEEQDSERSAFFIDSDNDFDEDI
jgi:hypothetical protein